MEVLQLRILYRKTKMQVHQSQDYCYVIQDHALKEGSADENILKDADTGPKETSGKETLVHIFTRKTLINIMMIKMRR